MTIRRAVPDLQTDDLAASSAFYVDVLGFEVVMDLDWVRICASPDNPAVQVTLLSRDATAPVDPQLSIEVDDIDGAHAAAVAAGHRIIHPLTDEPWGVRRFFVQEPGGAVVNVVGHR
jgi:catechol 2,3-dioxygenase-like lactoylglutathione lyase family enzyme